MPNKRPSITDWEIALQLYDTTFNTAYNGAAVISKRIEDDGSQNIYWVGLSVPEGREVVLHDRVLKLVNGTYHIDIYSGSFAGGLPMLVNPLRNSVPPTFTSQFNYDVTPDPAPTLLEEYTVASVTDSGSKEGTGALSEQNVIKIFTGPVDGMIKIERVSGTGSYFLSLQYVAWERSIF